MKRRRRKRINPDTIVLLKQIGIGLLVLIVAGLLVAGIWHGTRTPTLTIATIEASGGATIQPVVVEEIAHRTLEGTYLGLVPRRFSWLYPASEVQQSIEAIERIHSVELQRVGGTGLRIQYQEYVPFALWCQSVASDECLFLDETGYAFGQAPQLSGGSFLRFITTGTDAALAEPVTTSESFTSLFALTTLLAEQGWFVSHVEIDQVGDAFLTVVGGGELKVTVSDAPAQVVENLLVLVASPEFAHLEPGNFQYVDLRFGNRVFVNEEKAATPDGEAASSTASSTDAEGLEESD